MIIGSKHPAMMYAEGGYCRELDLSPASAQYLLPTIDCIISNPVFCEARFKWDVVQSALVHWLISAALGAPLLAVLGLIGCWQARTLI